MIKRYVFSRWLKNLLTGTNRVTAVIMILLMLSACGANKNDVPAAMDDTKTPSSASAVSPSPIALNKDVFDTKKYEGLLRVYFFDLNEPASANKTGDGDSEDCTLIITPDGRTMLIDAAREVNGKRVVEYLDKLGINKIDIAVASHRHGDHVGGYPEVISKKTVERFISAKYSPQEYVINALSAKGLKPEYPDDGYKFKLGNDVEFEVFADDSNIDQKAVRKENEETQFVNNHSMLLRMTYKNNSFLFSGDIYKQRESELVLNKERNIDSDVLKVPHHGYDTSSSTVFIKAVSPKYAVVEAYEIRSNVIMRYLQEKAKHYVTAINGNILITSDGNNLSVAEEKKTGRN